MLWKQNRENLLPLKKINGDQAELLAKQFLEEQDLIFIAKNFSCRFGEIDLIFTDSKSIIFTEVLMMCLTQ